MKNFFIYILLLTSLCSFAQRNGSSYISVLGGYEKNGWSIDAQGDLNNYADGIWRATLGMQSEKYTFREEKIPVMLYLGSLNYLHKILSLDRQDRIILRMGGGLVGGWEQVNKNKKYLDSGYELTQESKVIYGINILAEMEFYLFTFGHINQEVFLILQGDYHYFLNSDVGNRQPTIKGGLKMNLNL